MKLEARHLPSKRAAKNDRSSSEDVRASYPGRIEKSPLGFKIGRAGRSSWVANLIAAAFVPAFWELLVYQDGGPLWPVPVLATMAVLATYFLWPYKEYTVLNYRARCVQHGWSIRGMKTKKVVARFTEITTIALDPILRAERNMLTWWEYRVSAITDTGQKIALLDNSKDYDSCAAFTQHLASNLGVTPLLTPPERYLEVKKSKSGVSFQSREDGIGSRNFKLFLVGVALFIAFLVGAVVHSEVNAEPQPAAPMGAEFFSNGLEQHMPRGAHHVNPKDSGLGPVNPR